VGVKRKQHSAEFKARVAMASLSGEKTLAELSAEFGVHPTMISNWKQELLTRAGELFARGSKHVRFRHARRGTQIRPPPLRDRKFADSLRTCPRNGRNRRSLC
jgi:transposase-like protein